MVMIADWLWLAGETSAFQPMPGWQDTGASAFDVVLADAVGHADQPIHRLRLQRRQALGRRGRMRMVAKLTPPQVKINEIPGRQRRVDVGGLAALVGLIWHCRSSLLIS